jgi:hypothetical protein
MPAQKVLSKADITRHQNVVDNREALLKQHEKQLEAMDQAIKESEPLEYTVKEVKKPEGEVVKSQHGDAQAEMGMFVLTDSEGVSMIVPPDVLEQNFEEVK